MARRKLGNGNGGNGQHVAVSAVNGAYIRVSTDKQSEEGYSLDTQRDKIRAYCLAQGWALDERHEYVDAGLSGKSTDRPQFQAMVAAAQAGEVQRIVTYKLDRLAWNTRDFLATVDTLRAAGCDLVIIKESFDTSTPHGKFALTMFSALAELEVSMIAERTMSGRTQKAQQGGFNGRPSAYGYDYNGETFEPNGKADVVRSIFDRFLAGDSMRTIAASLSQDNTPTARGGKWYASTVAYILHNGFYAGLVQYNGEEVKGEHEALISEADYEAVQARLGKDAAA